MTDAEEIDLIADQNGNMKHTFGGLFRLSLLHGKKLEAQVYKEIKGRPKYIISSTVRSAKK